MMSNDADRFPIGKFRRGSLVGREARLELISRIAALPEEVRKTLEGAARSDGADGAGWPGWAATYRPGGWSVRQLVHHLADSHLNAYVRTRLALTEDTPTIKPYEEARWAELADVELTDPFVSVELLRALHLRWVNLLRSMTDADFDRPYFHPEQQRNVSLDEMLELYAWHGEHHLAHIRLGLSRASMGG